MRMKSAGMLKLNKNPLNRDGLPRPGSKLRELYDMFKLNKGKIVNYDNYKTGSSMIRSLTDFYGCDIRHLKVKKYMLAGEYIDGKYVSYFEP